MTPKTTLIKHLEANDCFPSDIQLDPTISKGELYEHATSGRVVHITSLDEFVDTTVIAYCQALGIPVPDSLEDAEHVYDILRSTEYPNRR